MKARLLRSAALGVFTLIGLLLLFGAVRADPGISTGRADLVVLRQWADSGRLSDNPEDPSHLTKPGYLIYLRAVLPHAGADSRENRRFLLLNAAWILLGVAGASAALARRFGPAAALLFLVGILALPTVRDCADHLTNEPLAIGLSLLVAAGIVLTPSERPWVGSLLGGAAGFVALIRPNLGMALLVIAAIAGATRTRRWSSVGAATCGFLVCLGLLGLVGRKAALALNPLGGEISRVVLWGTADYYWKPDVGGWPRGETAAQTTRLQLARARDRWTTLLATRGENRTRSLVWRASHGLLSAEELPGRWRSAAYMSADRLARKWWWALASILVGASFGAAIAGRNAWRFVSATLVLACIGQSLFLGADPRLALSLLPLLMLSLAAALPAAQVSPGALIVALAASLLVAFTCIRMPDVAAFDFALVTGPRGRIEQTVSASALPAGGPASLHFRLLQESPTAGISVFANDELVLHRDPAESSSWPAVFSTPLSEEVIARGRRDGLRLRIEIEAPASAEDAFLYYPVSPPVLGGRSLVDGQAALPSGFGGRTEGGLPVWITSAPSMPTPRVQRMSRKAGNSATARRRNAASNA